MSVGGPLNAHQAETLQIVSAVTAYDTVNGPILIGLGVGGYSGDPAQDETLLNPNVISLDYKVDERPRFRGGSQRLITPGGIIRIRIENGRLPHFHSRLPTQRELQELHIYWIVPKTEDALEQGIRQARRAGWILAEENPVDDPEPSASS